jgi:hypothetical protein
VLGGALSLPFREAIPGMGLGGVRRLLPDDCSTTSNSRPDGGATLFVARSIIFGVEDCGAGAASVSLPGCTRLRCGRGGGLTSPFAFAVINASNFFTSIAMLLCTSALKMAASSWLKPPPAIVTGTVTGAWFVGPGGFA